MEGKTGIIHKHWGWGEKSFQTQLDTISLITAITSHLYANMRYKLTYLLLYLTHLQTPVADRAATPDFSPLQGTKMEVRADTSPAEE